jgi:hypothetical protein
MAPGTRNETSYTTPCRAVPAKRKQEPTLEPVYGHLLPSIRVLRVERRRIKLDLEASKVGTRTKQEEYQTLPSIPVMGGVLGVEVEALLVVSCRRS